MQQLRQADLDLEVTNQNRPGRSERLAGAWWILPSALLGLAGWVAIFHGIGLL